MTYSTLNMPTSLRRGRGSREPATYVSMCEQWGSKKKSDCIFKCSPPSVVSTASWRKRTTAFSKPLRHVSNSLFRLVFLASFVSLQTVCLTIWAYERDGLALSAQLCAHMHLYFCFSMGGFIGACRVNQTVGCICVCTYINSWCSVC